MVGNYNADEDVLQQDAEEMGDLLVWHNPLLEEGGGNSLEAEETLWLRIARPDDNPDGNPLLAKAGQLVIGDDFADSMELTITRKIAHLERPAPGAWEDTQGGLLCYSDDGIQGIGNPGIRCSECPMQKWNSELKRRECSAVMSLALETEDGETVFRNMRRKEFDTTGRRVNKMWRLSEGQPIKVIAFSIPDKSSDGVYEYYRLGLKPVDDAS